MRKKLVFFAVAFVLIAAALAVSFFQISSVKAQSTMSPGESWTYKDLRLELINITSSLCPPGVDCLWQGEINPEVNITNVQTHDSLQQRMGTVTKTYIDLPPYRITLENATTLSATLSVELE